MKKKFIIITSIFQPTEAIRKFAKFSKWQIVVVGDKKTPPDWSHKNVIYLSPDDQDKLGYEILKHLPWNHYCRKMVGYLYAISKGAEVIYDTDDDNIPIARWFEPQFEGSFRTLEGSTFVNIYTFFTKKKVWPRGLPLKLIGKKQKTAFRKSHAKIGIWQGLADNDPDVDAIYRLTDNTPIFFSKMPPIVLKKGTCCPINSQNTFFHKDAFTLLYLPAFVTFRFTDILRGLIAQPILWSKDRLTGFTSATVVQKRNEHDYLKDFESEIPVYLHGEMAHMIACQQADPSKSMENSLVKTYKKLEKSGIVAKRELLLLNAWQNDLKNLTK